MTLRRAAAVVLLASVAAVPATGGDAPAATSEVLVLATIHAPWQFRSARFTPAHVRAALDAARGDVVGVETPPEWFARGKFHEVTYEAQAIAVPWARAHGVPVVPVDWQDLPTREAKEADVERQRLDGLRAGLAGGGALAAGYYGWMAPDAIAETAAFFRNPDFDFDLVNGIGSNTWGKQALQGGGDPSAPGFGGRRNQGIVANCVRAMEAHPGKRLVVVIGAGHKPVLDAILATRPGVKLLRLGADVPAPTPEAVAAAWTTDDLLCVLGHSLDGERSYFRPELVDLPRMRTTLDLLAVRPDSKDAAAYFRARLLSAEAAMETSEKRRSDLVRQAEAILASLEPRTPSTTLYPFPMDAWRMRYSFAQAVRVERARALLARAERAAAKTILDALASERATAPESGTPVSSTDLLAREFPRTLLVDPR